MNIFKYLLYRLYEKRLQREIAAGAKPRHVAVILDGNRRFATERQMDHVWGHERGYEKVESLIDWCIEIGVGELTLFAFSTENFKRPQDEVKALMNLLEKACRQLEKDPRIHNNQVRVHALGRLNLLPDSLQEAIRSVEQATEKYDRFHLNVALSYGGRAEIIDAVRQIYQKVEAGELAIDDVTEDVLGQHLYKEDMPDPDMIIRTSGEMRLSGFLLWQSAYSELYFTDVFFPAFRRVDFLRAVRNYQRRERRYGR